jgi:SAM-dependent MidA family methyltransferase
MPPSADGHRPVLVLAHELFDALPVHQFQYRTANKSWSERLVDVAPAQESAADASTVGVNSNSGLRLVLAPSATPTFAACSKLLGNIRDPQDGDVVEFSPASSALAFEIGHAIGQHGGGDGVVRLRDGCKDAHVCVAVRSIQLV